MAKNEISIDVRPTKKSQITRNFMRDYIRYKAKGKDDKQWFYNLVEANQKDDGTFDYPAIRTEFCKKYFPELLAEKKSFLTEIRDFNTAAENK